MSIPFALITPDGQKGLVSIEMPEWVEQLAHKFIESGGWFEVMGFNFEDGRVYLSARRDINGESRELASQICGITDLAIKEAVAKLVLVVTGLTTSPFEA